MTKKIKVLILALVLTAGLSSRSYATMPTFDAVNAALSEIRNAILQTEWAKDLALAMERLQQLKATYSELLRFHSGLDDYFRSFLGDPLNKLFDLRGSKARDAFVDFGFITPQIEIVESRSEPGNIRDALEQITGEIPDSELRPYIPFEEMQVVSGYQTAQEIRKAGELTREAAEDLSMQAQSASPKGAARLGVEASTQMMVLEQQNQEAMAKLIELQATSIAQVSREEKRYERERLRYMQEFNSALDSIWEVG